MTNDIRGYPMFRIAVVAALSLVCLSARAENWVKLSESDAGQLLADSESMEVRGSHVKVWIRQTFTQAKQHLGKPYNHNLSLAEFDCAGNKYRYLSVAVFNGSDRIAMDSSTTDWEYTAPSTYAATVADAVCDLVDRQAAYLDGWESAARAARGAQDEAEAGHRQKGVIR